MRQERALDTIVETFELPRPEDIRAMGFVVKLRELDPDSEEVAQLARDYVITPAVEKEVYPASSTTCNRSSIEARSTAAFIHDSFGGGKSHFMTMLSLLVEGAPAAWRKSRPVLNGALGCPPSSSRSSS